jgi:AraC-like DNA-binding protein
MVDEILNIRKESDKAALRWSFFPVAQHLAYMRGVRGGLGWLFALADKQTSAAIHAMHDDPAHRGTLQELAERAGMSRSTFALKFKETVGASAMECLTRWRMLLSVIALLVGYESESAFSTAFKRVMGCSPRAEASFARREPAEKPAAGKIARPPNSRGRRNQTACHQCRYARLLAM